MYFSSRLVAFKNQNKHEFCHNNHSRIVSNMTNNDHYNGNSQIYFIKIKSVAEAPTKFAIIWTLECEYKRVVNILSGGPRVTKAECCPKHSVDFKISLTFYFHCEEGRIFLSPPVRPMSSRSNQDNKTEHLMMKVL